jgi:hypothetical protein
MLTNFVTALSKPINFVQKACRLVPQDSSRSCHRPKHPTSNRSLACFLYCIILMSFVRDGEAKNPGPVLGTSNPTGPLGKAPLYDSILTDPLEPTIWGVSESAWDEAAPPRDVTEDCVSLEGIPRVLQAPEHHPMGECLQPLHQWLHRLTSTGDGQPLWLSSYQLYAHFQAVTSGWGFQYVRKDRTWVLADTYVHSQGFDFPKLAGWLQAIIKQYAKTMNLHAEAHPRQPWGGAIRSWQRCLHLRASPAEFGAMYRYFRDQGASGTKKVKEPMGRLQPSRGWL